MNIYEKLQTARVELQELNLKKSGLNKFANFKYYELSDFLPQINSIFNKFKLFSKFDLLEEKAILTIINIENTEETLTFETTKTEAQLKGATNIQQLGATHTYCRRYLYMNALEITENDIVDATIEKDKQQQKKETKKITIDTYLVAIRKYEKEYQTEIKDYLVDKALMEIEDLNFEQAKELAIQIKDKVKGGK